MCILPDKRRFAPLRRDAAALLAGGLLCCLPGSIAAADCPIQWGTVLIVPADCTYVVTGTVACEYVYVSKDGILELAAGAELRVKYELVIDPDGVFRFNADDGQMQPTLRATGPLEISGAITVTDPADGDGGAGGQIAMDISGSWVVLGADGLITSDAGPLDITADIKNNGVIRGTGDTAGKRIRITGAILAQSHGRFEVADHDNAKITFAIGSGATITGGAHFDVRAGSLEFYDSVSTDGGVRILSGMILVGAGSTFQATGPFVEP